MLHLISIAAFFGALFLVAAAIGLWQVAAGPVPMPISGRAQTGSPRMRAAAMAAVIAFGFSAVGAALAIVDWVIRVTGAG